jgi:hypothetical protein
VKRLSRLRPTPALVVAMTALVVAMSGAAVALPGTGTVGSNDIKKGAITQSLIAKNAVRSKQVLGKSLKGNDLRDKTVKAKQIADGTITSQQVAEDGLDSSNLSDHKVLGDADGKLLKLTATDGATAAAARTAAPATELYKKGQLTITAKCFRDTTTDQTSAEIYIATSVNGAIFDGADELSGGPAATDFLNTDTAEELRRLDVITVTGPNGQMDESEFTAIAPDGTRLIGQTIVAAKDGALAGGNGAYGDGNVCLFGGEVAG